MPSLSSTFGFVFAKGGYEYGTRVAVINDSPIFKAGMIESAGYNGSGQGLTLVSERRLELSGTIVGATQEGLRQAKDDFMMYHQHGAVDQIVISGNRWLWGAVDGAIPFAVHNSRIWKWEAQIICGDPFYYEHGLKSKTLSTTPSSTVTTTVASGDGLGGNAFATPYIEFNVASIATPGISFIEFANISGYLDGYKYRQQSFRFYPRDTGLHTVYFGPNCTDDQAINVKRRHRVYHASEGTAVSKYRRDTGELILLPSYTNSISTTLSGITLTGTTAIKWFNRYI